MVLTKMKQTSTQINDYLPDSYKCNFLKGGDCALLRNYFLFKNIKNTWLNVTFSFYISIILQ
jgi:hypothetical protein